MPHAHLTQRRPGHELIQQTIDAAGEIDKDAGEIDDPEKRRDSRAIAATLKLKAADALRNLYRKNSGSIRGSGVDDPQARWTLRR